MKHQDKINVSNDSGTIYVVATPIGNLADISWRAIETLKRVDTILAEDTRHTMALLRHYGVATRCFSFHEHNERHQSARLCERVAQGATIALVSDAGTPLISDPGFYFVRMARAKNLHIVPIPGANAMVSALSVAGLPSDRFIFEGFLPAKAEMRKKYLMTMQHEPRTLIFYEAPHRLLATLQCMGEVFGGTRDVVLARELTKRYETVKKLSLSEMLQWVDESRDQTKGEMVLLVAGADKLSQGPQEIQKMLTILLDEMPLKQAAHVAAKLTGGKKNELYQLALQLKNNPAVGDGDEMN